MTTGKRQIEARGGMWPRGEDLIRQRYALPPSPTGEGFWIVMAAGSRRYRFASAGIPHSPFLIPHSITFLIQLRSCR